MFAIKNSDTNLFISGFNKRHQIVQCTCINEHVKSFHTEQLADQWIKQYVDRGFGITNYEIVNFNYCNPLKR